MQTERTTILEALAFGKPTFALNRGGTPELKVYERRPGQLQLFDSLEDLVASLVSKNPVQEDLPIPGEPSKADISVLLSSILRIYTSERV